MKSKQKGFSIIEVLVAIVILAAISVMVNQTSTTSINTSDRVSQKSASLWVARDRISELRVKIRLMGTLSDSDFKSRETEVLGRDYISDVQTSKSTAYLERVTVRVFSADDKEQPISSITAYLPVIKGAQ